MVVPGSGPPVDAGSGILNPSVTLPIEPPKVDSSRTPPIEPGNPGNTTLVGSAANCSVSAAQTAGSNNATTTKTPDRIDFTTLTSVIFPTTRTPERIGGS